MKKNRKIRRCLLPAVFAAMTVWTAGCVDDPIEIAPANRVGSDGTVVVNAMLGDMKTTVPTRASGKAYGFEDFDEFASNDGKNQDSPLVPILIRQWKKSGESDWKTHEALYTDKSTVAGSLASYPVDTFNTYFSKASLSAEYDNVNYNYKPFDGKSLPEPLTWGKATDKSCFSAWTPVVRTYYRNGHDYENYKFEHVEDWVYMDPDGPDSDGREYGTVKFFRWTLDGGSSTRLRDTLYVGKSNSALASLENFIGISGQVIDEAADTDVRHTHEPHMIGHTGTESVEDNPPLTYKTNGASVSMRFQHLVSYINITGITITRSDGDVVSLSSHWAAVVNFPNLPRYARFTTGDPTKGEAPHLLTEREDDPHKENLSEYFCKYFNRKVQENGSNVIPDEYTSIVERKGLATFWNQKMYVPPFNLNDDTLGEFVVYVVANDSADAYKDYKYYKWDEDSRLSETPQYGYNRKYAIDGRYYGNLSSIAEAIRSQKLTLPGYTEGKEDLQTWLEAGEGLRLTMQLADGKVTGITVSIQGWGDASGGQTETHLRSGIYSVNDLNDLYDNYWQKDGDVPLPDGLAGTDNKIYLYDDLDFVKANELEVMMRNDGYELEGQGHVIKCTKFHERGANKDGHIHDLFIEATEGSRDSDLGSSREGKYTIFWYDFDGHLQIFDTWDAAIAARNEQLAEKGIS